MEQKKKKYFKWCFMKIQLPAAPWQATSGGHCRYVIQMPPAARNNYTGWIFGPFWSQNPKLFFTNFFLLVY